MKKIIFPVLVLLLIMGSSCQEKIDIEKEKEAIIAVIDGETEAFLELDFDRIASTYVQDETNIRLTAGKNGYMYLTGWEEISSVFKEWLEGYSEPPENYEILKTDYEIKVYKESAWAIFYDTFYENEVETSKGVGVRFLEKVDGEWKVVYLSTVWISDYEEEVEEAEEDPGEE